LLDPPPPDGDDEKRLKLVGLTHTPDIPLTGPMLVYVNSYKPKKKKKKKNENMRNMRVGWSWVSWERSRV